MSLCLSPPGQKKGGQSLLGGLDVCVSRNFFGAQVNSFETQLPAPADLKALGGGDTFRAVFIRAPAVLEAGPQVQVCADVFVGGCKYYCSVASQQPPRRRRPKGARLREGLPTAATHNFHTHLTH